MATPRTQAVAESKQLENFVNGVTVMTDANHVLENTDSIRTLILDTNEKITDGTCFFICYAKYLKELWLSDKVDVYQFIPVSYTHLDVYKRQAQAFFLPSMAMKKKELTASRNG